MDSPSPPAPMTARKMRGQISPLLPKHPFSNANGVRRAICQTENEDFASDVRVVEIVASKGRAARDPVQEAAGGHLGDDSMVGNSLQFSPRSPLPGLEAGEGPLGGVRNSLRFSPRSPLQGLEAYAWAGNSGTASGPVSLRPSNATPSSFNFLKLKIPCEIVNVDDDDSDASVSRCSSEQGVAMLGCTHSPHFQSPGNQTYVVLSSDKDSASEKASDSKQQDGSSSPKEEEEVSSGHIVQRRSARILKLSQKQEKLLSQSQLGANSKEDIRLAQAKKELSTGKNQRCKPGNSSEMEEEGQQLIAAINREDPPLLEQECVQNQEVESIPSNPQSGNPGLNQEPPFESGGAAKKVKDTLRLFNSYYLRNVQEEEDRCRQLHVSNGNKRKSDKNIDADRKKSRRPDLKAINQMKSGNLVLYRTKTIGHIPGIAVGDQFFSRCEMIAIGLHDHWLSGIDYMGLSCKKLLPPDYKLPIAISLVLSGNYEDDVDNSDDVVYTGSGGNDLLGNKRQIADQTMDRGNLALKNSMKQSLPVRLIRGHKTKKSYTGKVYTYDGLYKVKDFWAEKGISGFTVYKFRLHRIGGQPLLTTDQVHFCRGQVPSSTAELRGLVCPDISAGLELVPIPATNVIDDPPFSPSGFRYITEVDVDKDVPKSSPGIGCKCEGECVDDRRCACAIRNGAKFPYVTKNGGRLVEPLDVVYECGPQCGCGPGCSNRVSQRGLHYRLEVFRTAHKGWGVRSWDSIPAGSPVCEYTGLLMKTEDADNINDNDFIFELDCLETIKGIGGRQRRILSKANTMNENVEVADVDSNGQPEYCINAGNSGNVSRFINHSCEPNLFVQCILNAHHDLAKPRIFLFASENIHPLQELTYDYGYELDSVVVDGLVKRLPCYCGVHGCRKRLY